MKDPIINYLTINNDEQRLKDYLKYDVQDEISKVVLERLIHEFDLTLEYDNKQLQDELIPVINYLLDCYVG